MISLTLMLISLSLMHLWSSHWLALSNQAQRLGIQYMFVELYWSFIVYCKSTHLFSKWWADQWDKRKVKQTTFDTAWISRKMQCCVFPNGKNNDSIHTLILNILFMTHNYNDQLTLKRSCSDVTNGKEIDHFPHEALYLPSAIRCAFKWLM